MADDEKRRFSWYEPIGRRGRVILITVATAIVVGALIAALALGIPFF